MKHLVIFGFGFSARALAPQLRSKGWRVTGTSRSAEGAEKIRAAGFEAAVFDGTQPSADVQSALGSATHIVISVPPGDAGDPVLALHGADIAGAAKLAWIGYLSTIGVYGDHDGAWVDETTEPVPVSERSRRRLEAEQAWHALQDVRGDGRPRVQVFRLSGIYGPGRSAIDQLLRGKARSIVKPGQVFNRIHVEDVAGAVEAAIEAQFNSGGSHAVYNVTDDEPSPPQEVTAFAAQLLGRPAPPEVTFEEAQLSEMGRSFYGEVKRVRNERLKSDLNYAFRYPTYREGLKDIAERLP